MIAVVGLLAPALPARADDAAVVSAPAPAAVKAALDSSKFNELYDPILAYKFQYPIETASGKPLKVITARAPEKYSSAAPLSADARQRIVSELVDFKDFVTISVTVGPASGVLKGVPQAQWKPMDVALTVLIDRSTARVSTGQRVALNDVERVFKEQREGQDYWVYEHLSQGSPTITTRARETFRHALAVTTTRPGLDGQPYLYTLNLVCPQELWDDAQPVFQAAVDSFRLVPTTNSYIAPDKDPWQFW